MVHGLFPDSPNVDAKSSDTIVPVVRSLSLNNEHDSPSRTAYGDLLNRALEALYYQVTNTTNKLYVKQRLDSSRAFLSTLSALYILPTENFACLCTSIYYALTSFYPDTPPDSNAGSPLADLSKEGKTRNPVKGMSSQEGKLEKYITNAIEALISLINNYWE